MADLTTSYLGLKLRNPIIAGSSGLTASAAGVQALEQSGAGAVVLKSIFEEEIVMEHRDLLREVAARGYDVDAYEYYDQQIRGDKLGEYTALIAACKSSVSIPVIASVNCMYSHEWISFAKEIEFSEFIPTGTFNFAQLRSLKVVLNKSALPAVDFELTEMRVEIVPEPSSVVLGLCGAGALGFTCWRRKRRPAVRRG